MKITMGLSALLLSTVTWAANNSSNDFGRSDTEINAITTEELSYRFHISGEIFVVSQDGERLINMANEKREWEFGGQFEKPLESNWSFQQKGLPTVALKQKWMMSTDGKLTVEITQYENMERGQESEVKYGKVVKEQKISIKNYAPVDWIIPGNSQNIVVRLTPGVWPKSDPVDIGALPLSGKNLAIYDGSGNVWADQIDGKHPAVFFGATTHKGSVFLSFIPFKGAKLIGEAKGGRIKIKSGKDKIYVQSETPLVPDNVRANVYGIINKDLTTVRLNSVLTYSSDKEPEFVKRISK